MIFDPLGQVYDEYLGWPGDPLPTGPPWTLGDNFKVTRDGDAWTVEAAIPLEKLGLKQVKSGDVWGTNVYRNGMNVVSMFSHAAGHGAVWCALSAGVLGTCSGSDAGPRLASAVPTPSQTCANGGR